MPQISTLEDSNSEYGQLVEVEVEDAVKEPTCELREKRVRVNDQCTLNVSEFD